MKVIFNGILKDDHEIGLNDLYRAVFFADGIFESIYMTSSSVFLFDFHLERLIKGMNGLFLEFSEPISPQRLLDEISALKKLFPHSDSARIKIAIWRKGKGTYKPLAERKANYLITLDQSPLFQIKEIQNISFSKNEKLIVNSYDNLKSLAGLPYVLGNFEKEDLHTDELILLDHNGCISEALSSNIILFKDKEIHVPVKTSAYVEGCMLRYLSQRFTEAGFNYIEGNIQKDTLKSFDFLLFCNSFSIRYMSLLKSRPDVIEHLGIFIEEQPKLLLPL